MIVWRGFSAEPPASFPVTAATRRERRWLGAVVGSANVIDFLDANEGRAAGTGLALARRPSRRGGRPRVNTAWGKGSTEASDVLWPGALVDGKYRVERLLGRGGMGEVYLAAHERLGRRVAVKVLKESFLREPSVYARFQREALAASHLRSPHIAEVSDLGRLDNGLPFMVVEYLEGQDVSTYFHERGPLPAHEVLEILLQVCAGLEVAHHAGVVHRDLKPANLFLVPQTGRGPLVKILDFGVAKATGPLVSSRAGLTQLTIAGGMIGSAHYMAPEQMESAKDVDPRADLWSIGVIGFRLLTGRFPYEGASVEDLFVSMVSRPPPSLGSLRPDAPHQLRVGLEGCLRADRDERWPSVAALRAILSTGMAPGAPPVSQSLHVAAEPSQIAAAAGPVFFPGTQKYVESAGTARNRGIAMGMLLFLVLTLLLGTGSCVGLFAYSQSHPAALPSGAKPPAGKAPFIAR